HVVYRHASNPSFAMELLEDVERALLASGNGSPNLLRALVGHAVERGVAAEIRAFDPLRQMFVWTKDVPAISSIWDFTGIGPAAGQLFDVTTVDGIASHLLRWYGELVHYSTYF